MRTTLTIAALLVTVTALPLAAATHGDPTHGILPHSVTDDPTGIQPVSVSTPHPYEQGTTQTWEITADGADSISVHFERYEIDGRYNKWVGGCSGSEVHIYDANTGIQLETFCGRSFNQDNDFWTKHYATDAITIELDATGWGGQYGFDVYEVALDGAEPITSIPYSEQVDADSGRNIDTRIDPFQPTDSNAKGYVSVDGAYGPVEISTRTDAAQGDVTICQGWICQDYKGTWVQHDTTIEADGTTSSAYVEALILEDDSEPTGYRVDHLVVSCSIGDATSCPSPNGVPAP